MTRQSVQISIPSPCHESWQQMEATTCGAFCHSCQREVIDFSKMTDREVVEYLQKHQTECGRFRKDQVNTNLTIPKTDNGVFRWRALLLGLLPIISAKYASAAILSPTNQICQIGESRTDTTATTPKSKYIKISGTVHDENSIKPFAGVQVMMLDVMSKNSGMSAITDSDGNFSITINRVHFNNIQPRLSLSHYGYQTKEVYVNDDAEQFYNVTMKSLQIKETHLVGAITIKPTPAQSIRWWFRRTFRSHRHR